MLLFCFFCIFGLGSTFEFDWDQDMLLRYSKIKILNSCLGASFVQSWKESVEASTIKCFAEETLGSMPVLPPSLEDALRRNNFVSNVDLSPTQHPSAIFDFLNFMSAANHPQTHPTYPQGIPIPFHPQQLPIPYHPSFQEPQHPFLVYKMPSSLHKRAVVKHKFAPLVQSQQSAAKSVLHGSQRVWKRDTEQTEERTNSRKSKIFSLKPEWRTSETEEFGALLDVAPTMDSVRRQIGDRISNITCVLKSMEVLDESGRPNYARNTELINRLKVSDRLRSALHDAHSFCKEFSQCVPVHRVSNLLVNEVGQSLVFLKCLKKKVLNVCVQEDMRASGVLEPFGDGLFRGSNAGFSYAPGVGTLFRDTPKDVARNIEDFFASEDEATFGL